MSLNTLHVSRPDCTLRHSRCSAVACGTQGMGFPTEIIPMEGDELGPNWVKLVSGEAHMWPEVWTTEAGHSPCASQGPPLRRAPTHAS